MKRWLPDMGKHILTLQVDRNPEATTFTAGEKLEVNVSKLRRTGSPLTAGRFAISGKEGVLVITEIV